MQFVNSMIGNAYKQHPPAQQQQQLSIGTFAYPNIDSDQFDFDNPLFPSYGIRGNSSNSSNKSDNSLSSLNSYKLLQGKHKRKSTCSSSNSVAVLMAVGPNNNINNNFINSHGHLQAMNEGWDNVVKSTVNDEFIRNPEEIMRELDHISSSPLFDVPSQQHQQLRVDQFQHCLNVFGNSNCNNVDDIIITEMGPAIPTQPHDVISPVYCLYTETKPSTVNFHFEPQENGNDNDNDDNDNDNKINNDIEEMMARAEQKELSLARYREKRIKRVFNRVRYSLRKQVSESRPRVKGRFIKSNTDESSSTPTTTTTTNSFSSQNTSNTTANITLPLASSTPPLTINSPNINTTATAASTPSESNTPSPNANSITQTVSGSNNINPSDNINTRKRKPSFFRIGSRTLLPIFNSQEEDTTSAQSPSSAQKPPRRSFFSFSKSAVDEKPPRPRLDLTEPETPSKPNETKLESGKRRMSWTKTLFG